MHSLTDTGACNLVNHSKTKIKTKNLTGETFTNTLSHTGTSESNVMVEIEINST